MPALFACLCSNPVTAAILAVGLAASFVIKAANDNADDDEAD